MTTEELSWEERNNLYKFCLIPTFIVFFLILIYFNYLMYTDSLKTLWDFITRVGWLYIFMPTAFFITFEVLYHQRIEKPLKFHFKRLLGRLLLLLLSTLSFFGFLLVIQPVFYPIVGDWVGVVGSVLWVIFFTLVVIKFRKLFAKFDRGDW